MSQVPAAVAATTPKPRIICRTPRTLAGRGGRTSVTRWMTTSPTTASAPSSSEASSTTAPAATISAAASPATVGPGGASCPCMRRTWARTCGMDDAMRAPRIEPQAHGRAASRRRRLGRPWSPRWRRPASPRSPARGDGSASAGRTRAPRRREGRRRARAATRRYRVPGARPGRRPRPGPPARRSRPGPPAADARTPAALRGTCPSRSRRRPMSSRRSGVRTRNASSAAAASSRPATLGADEQPEQPWLQREAPAAVLGRHGHRAQRWPLRDPPGSRSHPGAGQARSAEAPTELVMVPSRKRTPRFGWLPIRG